MELTNTPRPHTLRGAILIAAGVALCSLVFSGWRSFTACGWDTSYCAQSRLKNGYYAGVLRDEVTGNIIRSRRVQLDLSSREDSAVGMTTDALGRYCIVWADETLLTAINVGPDHEIAFTSR